MRLSLTWYMLSDNLFCRGHGNHIPHIKWPSPFKVGYRTASLGVFENTIISLSYLLCHSPQTTCAESHFLFLAFYNHRFCLEIDLESSLGSHTDFFTTAAFFTGKSFARDILSAHRSLAA
jgi:hypothetical protein